MLICNPRVTDVKGVVLWKNPDRHPFAGATNTNSPALIRLRAVVSMVQVSLATYPDHMNKKRPREKCHGALVRPEYPQNVQFLAFRKFVYVGRWLKIGRC
jgi:hypothetical protein